MKAQLTRFLTIMVLTGVLVVGGPLVLRPNPGSAWAQSRVAPGMVSNPAAGGPRWLVVSIDADGNVGRFPSLALDSAGFPRIAYNDDTGDSLRYASWSPSGWQTETVRETSEGASLAIGYLDVPHVVYTYSFPRVDYSVRPGPVWLHQTAGVPGAGQALALDINGVPHVAFCGFGPAQGLHFLRKTAGGWDEMMVDPAACGARIPSIAVDADSIPHIAYDGLSDNSVRYAVLSGTTWLTMTVATSAEGPSLALDSHGNPSVAYTHAGPRVDYAVLSGTTWLIQTAGQIGAGKSLAMDQSDHPHIAYCGFGPSSGINYAHMTETGWVRESIWAHDCGDQNPSLKLDTLDRPHIAFYDSSAGDLLYASLGFRAFLPLVGKHLNAACSVEMPCTDQDRRP